MSLNVKVHDLMSDEFTHYMHLSKCVLLFQGSLESSVLNMEDVVPTVEETSMKRLVVGPLDVRLHSSAVHRILKMVTCAMDHEYEPYCTPEQGLSAHANCCFSRFTSLT